MEPLPVGNQFVVISLCFGILTLGRESEGRGGWKRRLYRAALCSISTEGAGISAVMHATHVLLTDKKLKSDSSEAGRISTKLVKLLYKQLEKKTALCLTQLII